jgi:hypothetical protein
MSAIYLYLEGWVHIELLFYKCTSMANTDIVYFLLLMFACYSGWRINCFLRIYIILIISMTTCMLVEDAHLPHIFCLKMLLFFFWQISMMIHIQCVVYHCSYLNWMWCNSSCGFVWTPKIHACPPIQINCRSFRQILSKMCLASWNMWQLIWIRGTVKVAIFIWMF